MTTKEAMKHLSDKIDYAEQCDDKWVDSVSIKALYVAVRAMAEERKKGKWMRNSNGTYSCCLCQSWIPNEQRYYANYCLFCGADMREEKTDAEIH